MNIKYQLLTLHRHKSDASNQRPDKERKIDDIVGTGGRRMACANVLSTKVINLAVYVH
jgi:Cu/Zn superoxide dismutase